MTSIELLKTDIVVIYKKKLNKYWECSYGAFLKNWSNYGWKIINKKVMKGILHKTELGWIVIYDQILGGGIIKRNQNSLPLHPEYQTILPLDLDLEGGEVEFDWCVIVEHYTGKGKEYAKLITPKQSTTPSQTFIMKDKDGVFYELPTKEDTKQTAIEWLIEQLTPSISLQQKHIDNYKTIAKEMEKQQIIKSRENGISEGYRRTNNFYYDKMVDSEQYFSKTYGSKGSDEIKTK